MKFPKKKWLGQPSKKENLEATLDKWFSKYIRLRDSDKNGICCCITCLRIFHWKEGDAGHFISRDRSATRYDERNVNAQCVPCNRFKSGLQYEHGLAIDKKYGPGTAQMLNILSKVHSKLNDFYYKRQIEIYKKKVKEMSNKLLIFN